MLTGYRQQNVLSQLKTASHHHQLLRYFAAFISTQLYSCMPAFKLQLCLEPKAVKKQLRTSYVEVVTIKEHVSWKL